MEREQIERLAMDLALGELNEDAAALFEAHRAVHPQADRWARDMLRACESTQRAVSAKTRVSQVHSTSCVGQPCRVWHLDWPAAGRRAAVVIFALLAGLAAGRWSAGPSASQPGPEATVVHDIPVQKSWAIVARESGQGFWHAKALALLDPEQAAASPSMMRSNLWNEYRQYIKEKSDG